MPSSTLDARFSLSLTGPFRRSVLWWRRCLLSCCLFALIACTAEMAFGGTIQTPNATLAVADNTTATETSTTESTDEAPLADTNNPTDTTQPDTAEPNAGQPKALQRQQKQKFLSVSFAMLMLILLLGLCCILLVIWWGSRLRHLSRKRSRRDSQQNELWFLKPPKPEVSDGEPPPDDSEPDSANEPPTP